MIQRASSIAAGLLVGVVAAGALLACTSGRGQETADASTYPQDAQVREVPDTRASTEDAAADAGGPPGPVCAIVAPTTCPEAGAPTYADVAPIFQARCAGCHTGMDGGPWPFDDYENVTDWEETIRASLLDCSMPPADAGALAEGEASAILAWMRCGLPR